MADKAYEEAFNSWYYCDDFKPLFKLMDERGENITFLVGSYKAYSDEMEEQMKSDPNYMAWEDPMGHPSQYI